MQARGGQGELFPILILNPSLLPCQTTKFEEEEEEHIKKEGQVVSPNVFFMKQTVGNACGTVGLLHSIGNCLDKIKCGRFIRSMMS